MDIQSSGGLLREPTTHLSADRIDLHFLAKENLSIHEQPDGHIHECLEEDGPVSSRTRGLYIPTHGRLPMELRFTVILTGAVFHAHDDLPAAAVL